MTTTTFSVLPSASLPIPHAVKSLWTTNFTSGSPNKTSAACAAHQQKGAKLLKGTGSKIISTSESKVRVGISSMFGLIMICQSTPPLTGQLWMMHTLQREWIMGHIALTLCQEPTVKMWFLTVCSTCQSIAKKIVQKLPSVPILDKEKWSIETFSLPQKTSQETAKSVQSDWYHPKTYIHLWSKKVYKHIKV